jgi:hypothetical protein
MDAREIGRRAQNFVDPLPAFGLQLSPHLAWMGRLRVICRSSVVSPRRLEGGVMRELRLLASLCLLSCAPSVSVPKAEISVTDTATRITRMTNSGPDGSYLVPNLLDGTYSISVTAQWFEKSVYSGVVDAGRATDMPLTLKLGAVIETVHVTADATPRGLSYYAARRSKSPVGIGFGLRQGDAGRKPRRKPGGRPEGLAPRRLSSWRVL